MDRLIALCGLAIVVCGALPIVALTAIFAAAHVLEWLDHA